MNHLDRTLQKLDRLQQRHRWSAFTYAVVKRYGEDKAGYQAALLTYYAFLALFPFLLVLTTLTQIITASHPQLQADIVSSVTNTFPVLGDQLSAHVHGLHKNGLALVVGLLFVCYGARGVADVFRGGVSHIWAVPGDEQAGFPQSALRSLGVLAVGGVGLVLASLASGVAAAAGHMLWVRLAALAADLLVLFGLFTMLFRLSLPRRISSADTRSGAAAAAVGLVILQSLGGYLLAHELKQLDVLYSYFALALGLIFWIYLQAQIVYYSTEIAVVKSRRLWPRRFSE